MFNILDEIVVKSFTVDKEVDDAVKVDIVNTRFVLVSVQGQITLPILPGNRVPRQDVSVAPAWSTVSVLKDDSTLKSFTNSAESMGRFTCVTLKV